MTPLPSPSPIYVVVEQSGGGTAWWSPTVLVPLAVAILALGGVVWSTWHNAKANRNAEDRRAEATIAAEDVRAKATIAAEDVRAKAAIAAEDRRHEHAIEAERQRHVIEARHGFYLSLEATGEALASELVGLSLALDEPDPPDVFSARVAKAVDAFSAQHDQAGLYSSTAVDFAATQLFVSGVIVEQTLRKPWPGAADELRDAVASAQSAASKLKALLRSEVGASDVP